MTPPADGESRLAPILDWVGFFAFASVGILAAFGEAISEGFSDRDVRTLLGLLFLATGALFVLLRRARRDIRRMDDLLTDVRFGAGTRRDRDAVDILVRALRTPDERAQETALRTLRKISGMDLGADPAAWEQWWAAGRSTFVRTGAPAGPGKAPPGKM